MMLVPKGFAVLVVLSCTAALLITLNACGGSGSSSSPLPTASLTVTPDTMQKGQSATISWSTTNATSVSISGLGTVAASGSQKVSPATNTAYTLTAQGPGGNQQALASLVLTTTPITHVVIIFQENRTVDNLFQDPKLVAAGADIQTTGWNKGGTLITPKEEHLQTTYDLGHTHKDFVAMYDGGLMDGAGNITVRCAPGKTNCAPTDPQFYYVNPADVQPYFQMAERYTFADRMFQTNQGPSFPAHQFIISGTSAPTAPGAPYSDWFAAENPAGGGIDHPGQQTGCTAPLGESVMLIDPKGGESKDYNQGFPCYDHPTLTDLFKSSYISWRYYTPSAGSLWTGPNAIQHICVPNTAGTCTGSDWINGVVLQSGSGNVHTPTAVLADISSGKLPNVTWVIPSGQASDHALDNDGSGPSWVTQVVNAIGTGPYWANTAIFITWDDWGGWYDHVVPPIDPKFGYYEYGFRVPLIVVSPYVKEKYVSHVQHDFGSILKFVEGNFSLPAVHDDYADARADDFSDSFNFSQTPLKFQTIPVPKVKRSRRAEQQLPSDPDDD